jgi:type IX secretion system substrate protein
MTVQGDQISNEPNIVLAAGEIDIQNGTNNISLTSDAANHNLALVTRGNPSFYDACSSTALSPLVSTNLAAYCTTGYMGNQYKANQAAVRTTQPTANNTKGSPSALAATTAMVQTALGTNITLGIFPNPTSGVVYLNLSAQNAGNLIVNLSDATGNTVMHTSYSANAGANSYKLDMSTLNSGVYFINITDENGVTIKNDKLVLMGQ